MSFIVYEQKQQKNKISNEMIKSWQLNFFSKTIQSLFLKIPYVYLTEIIFNLLVRQAKIKYLSLNEQTKFKKIFQQNSEIYKSDMLQLIVLCRTEVLKNQLYFVIKMRQSDHLLRHKPKLCFNWWRKFMTEKYGADLRWFDKIAKQKDCFRLKSFEFKENLSKMLMNTEHAKCANNIVSFFNKNQKNQVEFLIFLNTIRLHEKSQSMKIVSKKITDDQSQFKTTRINQPQNLHQKCLTHSIVFDTANYFTSKKSQNNFDIKNSLYLRFSPDQKRLKTQPPYHHSNSLNISQSVTKEKLESSNKINQIRTLSVKLKKKLIRVNKINSIENKRTTKKIFQQS